NSDTTTESFQNRLVAVEDAINALISTTNTKIKIVAVSETEYEKKLTEKFEQAQTITATAGKPVVIGKNYKNDAKPFYPDENNTQDYFYQLQFPNVLDNQIDICYIRDYTTYAKLATSGGLYSLSPYIMSESASYPRFKKIIKNELFNSMLINNNLYGVPNNRAYAEDNYQFVLIDKTLADNAGLSIDASKITSILECEEIITKIGELGVSGVVPYVGGDAKYAPGIVFWGKEGNNVITSTVDNPTPVKLMDNEAYMSYTMLYKKLAEANYAKFELAEGEKAAVFHYEGTLESAQQLYSENYYILKTRTPVLSEQDVFGSMFAISEYSINYERAMSVLYQLYTNSKLCTILQYGIEDVDYVLDKSVDENNPTIQLVKNEQGQLAYDMSGLTLGNGYVTYKGEGSVIDDWDYEKAVNYDSKVSKYIHLNSNYIKSENPAQMLADFANSEILGEFSREIFEEINAMSLSEFQAFIDVIAVAKELDVASIEKQILEGKEEYDLLKAKEELTEEETNKITDYEALLAKQATYKVNETFYKLATTDIINTSLARYTTINKSYNK
ncbi:MAG: hypothetical protein J6A54_06190, partial [Clostridia bacterium]|nr:hypothetical protein [Clostridia bacterium]